MMRFFLDLHGCGQNAVIDDEGLEVADLAAARAQAILAAREIMAGEVVRGHLCLGCAIAIRDESGATVMALPFAEAVSVSFTNDC